MIGRIILKKLRNNFPYLYARYSYYKRTGRNLSYRNPQDLNEKLFWLNRYWQDRRIVEYSDKVAVRDYIKSKGYEHLLTKHYGVYKSVDEINFHTLPNQFVLKTNNSGAGWFISICKDKKTYNTESAKFLMAHGLKDVPGVQVADYQYQYIEPKIIAEEFLPNDGDNPRYEIQFFCFNGKAKHILVRNDLGDASKFSFAISYDTNWNRVKDRWNEDLSINVSRPVDLEKMIEIANSLAAPFPHVRVDLYYWLGEGRITFGELTFTTSGKVLSNYKESTLKQWGDELILPDKISLKWKDQFPSWQQFRDSVVIPSEIETDWNINKRLNM